MGSSQYEECRRVWFDYSNNDVQIRVGEGLEIRHGDEGVTDVLSSKVEFRVLIFSLFGSSGFICSVVSQVGRSVARAWRSWVDCVRG